MALAFAREGLGRVALSFIGEGGSSLGEWHEAINLCAARRLPAVFCVQNNQTALSTPVARSVGRPRVCGQSRRLRHCRASRSTAPIPDEIAAAFAWAVERARAGLGPALIELVSLRMCGHAHHDDMLYLGKDPQPGVGLPVAGSGLRGPLRSTPTGPRAIRFARTRHCSKRKGSSRLVHSIDLKSEAESMVEAQAASVIEAPWPVPADAGVGVLAGEPPRVRREPLEMSVRHSVDRRWGCRHWNRWPPSTGRAAQCSRGSCSACGTRSRPIPRVFVFGEDVGGKYGNAFLLLRPLLEEFGDRILNSTLAEGAVLGVCVGAALAGQRPIGEMQFNDFVATGFNQVVNNAAKIRYRWGGSVPMVLRMPWGGLRHAGPFHSQNTEAWFYRTPGLKIVVPSTPADARALMASAVADPDPVLYYEHIALYRDPRIKQVLDDAVPTPVPIGKAALRRAGEDIALISYGAYVHVAMRVADRLAAAGIEASVLDLRTLAPLDRDAVLALARHCHRVLIVHEDSRTGSIGESVAAIIQEEAFEWLDAPVRVIGALDTPVPSLATARRVLPARRRRNRARRAVARRVLTAFSSQLQLQVPSA